MTADYRLEARTRAGAYLANLPFRNLQGEFWRSQPKQIRFELPLHHPVVTRANVNPGITEVVLFRNNVRIYTGPVWNVTASSSDSKLSCDSESLESYLDLRRIDLDLRYNGAGGAIIWDLINRAQTGTDAALGFTQGTIQVAPTRSISYLKSQGLIYGDVIKELADDSTQGFDWEIDANRALQVYYPRPQTASRSRLLFGGLVTGYSVQVQGKFESNDIAVLGDTGIRSSAVIDTARRATYGLRQYVESNSDLKTNTAATQQAQRVLARRRDAKETPQLRLRTSDVNPFDGDLNYGQTAKVEVIDGWTQYNATMRCDGWQLTVGKTGSETIVLYMTDLRDVS